MTEPNSRMTQESLSGVVVSVVFPRQLSADIYLDDTLTAMRGQLYELMDNAMHYAEMLLNAEERHCEAQKDGETTTEESKE